MGILQNYNEGNMDALRSVKYSETGTQAPYVVKDVKNPPSNNDKTLGLQLNTRIDDTSRIAQMLIDKPGLKFASNQALLNASETTRKAKAAAAKKSGQGLDAAAFAAATSVIGSAGQVLKVVGSTLAQVPVNGTGTHFLRGFNPDTYIKSGDPSGLSGILGIDGVNGAARALEGAKIIPDGDPQKGLESFPIDDAYKVSKDIDSTTGALGLGKISENKYSQENNTLDEFIPQNSDLLNSVYSTEERNEIAKTGGTIIADNLGQEAYNQVAPSSYLKVSGSNTTFSKTSENKYYEKDNDTSSDYLTQGSVNTITTEIRQSMASSGEVIIPDNTDPNYIAPILSNLEASGSNTAFGDIQSELSKTKANTTNTAILAQTGSVITLQGTTVNTTATKKSFGITNQSVTGSVVGKEGYTVGLASTGSIRGSGTTTSNILNAQNGSVIPLKKEIGAKDTTATLGSNGSPLSIDGIETNQNITGSYTEPINPGSIQNFRTGPFAVDYNSETINKEIRVGLGNQGKPGVVRTNYTTDLELSDLINKLDVSDKKVTDDSRDFIKFNFQIITPEDTTFLYFRAFLTELSDSYTGAWDTTKYLGRAEDLYTYQGFSRSMNIGFNIAAASRQEMKPLYRKMAALASVTAPTYGGDGKFMRGTIAKVTVGDYIYEVPGIIESVNYTWNTDYNWEIAYQNVEGQTDDDMQELPQIMDCSLTFKPIHNFVPEAVGKVGGKTQLLPYITNPTPNGTGKAKFIE